MSLVFQSLVLGVLLGGLYALLAAGLTLYFGVMRVVMIAHSAFLILAAYLAWFFNRETGIDPLVSLLFTVPIFFVLGVTMQRTLLSRLRPATLTMMSVLLTFSVALVIEGMLGFVFSGTQRRIRLPYGGDSLELFGANIPVVKLIAFGLAAVSLLAALPDPQEDAVRPGPARHHPAPGGRPTDRHQHRARSPDTGSGSGLATAAIGGTALSLDSTIYPSLHWHWIGPLMAIIVVGGLGSVPGAAIAALVLGLGQSLLQIPMGTTWAQTIFYVALFATLMVRPQGFFGGRLAQRF